VSLFTAMFDGVAIGMSRADLEARARKAAAQGDRAAQAYLAGLAETDRLLGRASAPGVTHELFRAWRCPACGGRAATSSGRDRTITCAEGHRRMSDGKRPPFLMLLKR